MVWMDRRVAGTLSAGQPAPRSSTDHRQAIEVNRLCRCSVSANRRQLFIQVRRRPSVQGFVSPTLKFQLFDTADSWLISDD